MAFLFGATFGMWLIAVPVAWALRRFLQVRWYLSYLIALAVLIVPAGWVYSFNSGGRVSVAEGVALYGLAAVIAAAIIWATAFAGAKRKA